MIMKITKRIFIFVFAAITLLSIILLSSGCNVRIIQSDTALSETTETNGTTLEILTESELLETTTESVSETANITEKLTEPTTPEQTAAATELKPEDYIYKENISSASYIPLKSAEFKTLSTAEKPLAPDFIDNGAKCFFNEDKVETVWKNYMWQKYGNDSYCLMILADMANEFGGANSALYLPKYGIATVGGTRTNVNLTWTNPGDPNDVINLIFTVGAGELQVYKNTPQSKESYKVQMPLGAVDDGSSTRYYLPLYAVINEIGGGVMINPFGDGTSFIYTGNAIPQGYSGIWETTDRGDARQNIIRDGKTVSIPEYWRQLELNADGTFTETTRGYNSDGWDVVKYTGEYAFSGRILAMKYMYQTRYSGKDYNNLKADKVNEPYTLQESPNEPAIIPSYIDEWDLPEYLFMRDISPLYSKEIAEGQGG